MRGKWAQTQNKTHTNIVDSEKEFYELLTCTCTEVTNLIFPNDDVAWVSWRYSKDNVAAGKNVNVTVAAYVITQARLKVYEYLSKLGQSVLYSDTESVIFVQKDNDPEKWKRDYLGDLTDELEYGSGSFIQEFVSGGPKSMRFRYFEPRLENVQQNVKWRV